MFLKKLLDKLRDPVLSCRQFKEVGCSHVDGFLCDFPNCSIQKNYEKENENNSSEQNN